MRVDNAAQAQALLRALALGLGAGLLYDLLRPPRWTLCGPCAFLLDALYCLALGAALFLYAMSAPDGTLGIAALAAAWAGFLLYHAALSRLLLPLFSKLFQKMDIASKKTKKTLKKLWYFAKKYFQKLNLCFIVRR